MAHIPDDVWMHIAQFIPEDDLKTLFSVNRAFFHLSMNARYHTVVLRVMDLDTFKLVLRLQNVLVAKRVRCLHIHPLLVAWWLHKCAMEDFVTKSTLKFDWSDPTAEFLRLATHAISHMQNVARCTWTLPDRSSSFPLPPDFFPTWSLSCHNLEQLDLHIPFRNVPAARVLQLVHFPCLRDLSIFIDDSDWLPPMKERTTRARYILASFISRSNPTLKRLNIQITSYLRPTFFGKLGHFTQLIKLELTMPVFASEFKNEYEIIRFITKHAATLEYFAFAAPRHKTRSYAMNQHTQEGIKRIFSIDSPIKFPHLRTLELNVHEPTSISFTACIRPFVNTITTLVLKDQRLSKDALDILSSAFNRNPAAITSAWLDLVVLSVPTMDLLAERFPGLTDLKLTTSTMTGENDDVPIFGFSSEDDFCNALEGHTYSQWPLRNVIILVRLKCQCNLLSLRAMAAMARCVPSIRSFDSQGDMAMPDWPAEFPMKDFITIRCGCSSSTDWGSEWWPISDWGTVDDWGPATDWGPPGDGEPVFDWGSE